jgi:hypothetical protein
MSRSQSKLLTNISDGGVSVIVGDRGEQAPPKKVGAGGEMVSRKNFRIFMHFRHVL